VSKDILPLKANTKGSDFIIADLHGNRECFDAVIKNLPLGDNDRLFIAGDMVDRGEDSVGVIEAIMKHGKNIHVIRGNHEEMTLESIKGLEKVLELLKASDTPVNETSILEKMDNADDPLITSLKSNVRDNGGMWLVKLFAQEHAEGKLSLPPTESKVRMIEKFMSDLPYIISVEGEDKVLPFNVVHADMPLNDLELKRKISNGDLQLSDDKKRYAVWAREEDYDPNIGRTDYSTVTYCGHNIIGFDATECIRNGTSMIDLDFAAYLTNIALAVNHTRGIAVHVRNESKQVDEKQLKIAKNFSAQIRAYLAIRPYMKTLSDELKKIASEMHAAKPEDLNVVMSRGLSRINDQIETLMESIQIDKWSERDFYTYFLTSSEIDSNIIRAVMEKKLSLNIEEAKGKIKTPEQLELFKKNLSTITDGFNLYHQPSEPLTVNDLEQRLGFVRTEAKTSSQGLFAPKTGAPKVELEKLEEYIKETCEQFVAEKNYSGKDPDLDGIVKDAIELMTTLNTRVLQHNETHPSHARSFVLGETFFNDNSDYGLYFQLDKSENSYVKTCLKIADLKFQLTLIADKCPSDEILKVIIDDNHQTILTLIEKHNATSRHKIAEPSFESLSEFVQEARTKSPSPDKS
jgi:hypothetical protein